MKFYYEGKLIRTSKNHNYTHAVINIQTGSCIGCRTSEDACQSIITTEINGCLGGIRNSEEKIKALEAGKSGYYIKDGRRSWWHKFENSPFDTIESTNKRIEYLLEEIDRIKQNWKIVKLECK